MESIMLLTDLVPTPPDPDSLYDVFSTWVEGQGMTLYPAQAEALIEIVSGGNVILSTPTGSGKSLVATGAHFTALTSASTHVRPDFTRTRKLLLHERELSQLVGKVERAGYTLIPLDMHWTRGRAKVQIGLAKGKKLHDKRATEKERDWSREKARVMRHDR